MNKVKIKFNHTEDYNGKLYHGVVEFDLDKERPGWVDRWIVRGHEVFKEEVKKKVTKKKVSKKRIEKEEE